MKHLLITSFAALSLAACASTQSAYGPTNENGIGFKNIQLEPDRFRVSFTGRNVDEARDYSLLRAAELTDAEGFSHFKIVNGGTESNGPRSPTSIGVGVGRGFGRTRGGFGIGVGDIGRVIEGDKVRETIEVKLLRSGIPNDPNVYHAESIIKSIQPSLYPPLPPSQQPVQTP